MKYLMTIYANAQQTWGHPIFRHTEEGRALSEAERDRLEHQLMELFAELEKSGELISGHALASPSTARAVKVRDDKPIVTDGPYVEAKEQMAGFFVIDCATPERAEEIAATFPEAQFFAVELRPIMELSGEDI